MPLYTRPLDHQQKVAVSYIVACSRIWGNAVGSLKSIPEVSWFFWNQSSRFLTASFLLKNEYIWMAPKWRERYIYKTNHCFLLKTISYFENRTILYLENRMFAIFILRIFLIRKNKIERLQTIFLIWKNKIERFSNESMRISED